MKIINQIRNHHGLKKVLILTVFLVLLISASSCSFHKKKEEPPQLSTYGWNPQKMDEFTFYTHPDWERYSSKSFYTYVKINHIDYSQRFFVESVQQLGSRDPDDIYQEAILTSKNDEGKAAKFNYDAQSLVDYSSFLEEITNPQGVTFYVGKFTYAWAGRIILKREILVPQKNLHIRFFAESEDYGSYESGELQESLEKVYKEMLFHYGEKDYATGNSFVIDDTSMIILYPDNTFKHYLSRQNLSNKYYEGTYEAFYGVAAKDKLASAQEFGFSPFDAQILLDTQVDEGIKMESSKLGGYPIDFKVCPDTFHVITLHTQKFVKSSTEIEEINKDNLYFGHYINKENSFALTNADDFSTVKWEFNNAVN